MLEIGPGTGLLTRELVATGARVIAIEKDLTLYERLTKSFVGEERLTVIGADIRDIEPQKLELKTGEYILAANIPYYITGEIIRKFLTAHAQPKTIALLIQKEVAERVVGKAHGKRQKAKESILSLSVKAYGTPRIVKKVPRGNFSPPPSVDSAIIVIENISRDFFDGISEDLFFEVLHAGFASKRKQLAGNLAKKWAKEKVVNVLERIELPKHVRAEDVPLEKWRDMILQLSM